MQPVHLVLEHMLMRVADALGAELLAGMAFVGGCTTALMLTDPVSREAVRYTDDVDLIIHVLGFSDWLARVEQLKARGFQESPEDDVICRMRLPATAGPALIVDFMPDDANILGFSNRWYAPALQTADTRVLSNGRSIRVVTPVYFVATKLEAFLGRGHNDPLSSRDIEDILAVVDGRESLGLELARAESELRQYIAVRITELLNNPDFDYAVQSTARNNREREALIFKRLESMAQV